MHESATVVVGGTAEDDAAAFVTTWEAAARGEAVVAQSVLAVESWEGLAAVLTGARTRLLQHLRARPEPSVAALARALARPFRHVHADVAALEAAGLVSRASGQVRVTSDRIQVEIRL